MRRAGQGAGLVCVAATAALAMVAMTGCFVVHMVAPGPLVIDDFEDGDLAPADTDFGVWNCTSFNPASNREACSTDAGDGSTYGLYVEATIVDPPDGSQQHGGAGVVSLATPAVDFSSFRTIAFDVRVESGDPPIARDPILYVELGCGGASPTSGSAGDALYIYSGVRSVNAGWQTVSFDFTSLDFPEGTSVVGGVTECLRQVDAISILLDANLPDGATGQFYLFVDTVMVQ